MSEPMTIEDWLDSGELDLNATRADYDFAQEHDASDARLRASNAALEQRVSELAQEKIDQSKKAYDDFHEMDRLWSQRHRELHAENAALVALAQRGIDLAGQSTTEGAWTDWRNAARAALKAAGETP